MTAKGQQKRGEQVQGVVVEVARVQIAAVTAAIKFWGEWIQSADKYTRAISEELAGMSEGKETSRAAAGRLADLSREFLREMTHLPGAAVQQFNSEIEKIVKPSAKRSRKARAKD